MNIISSYCCHCCWLRRDVNARCAHADCIGLLQLFLHSKCLLHKCRRCFACPQFLAFFSRVPETPVFAAIPNLRVVNTPKFTMVPLSGCPFCLPSGGEHIEIYGVSSLWPPVYRNASRERANPQPNHTNARGLLRCGKGRTHGILLLLVYTYLYRYIYLFIYIFSYSMLFS